MERSSKGYPLHRLLSSRSFLPLLLSLLILALSTTTTIAFPPQRTNKLLIDNTFPIIQLGTYGQSGPALSVDGNLDTFSIGCDNCNGVVNNKPWLQIDLKQNMPVYGVKVYGPKQAPDNQNTDFISIHVGTTSDTTNLIADLLTPSLCYYHNSAVVIPNTGLEFTCQKGPIQGRYLTIVRQKGSHRPDVLSLAEIEVYLSIGGSDNLVLPSVGLIDTTLSTATQSSTCISGYGANLALDKNPATVSIACVQTGLTAWWSIDLRTFAQVSSVEILASDNVNYANTVNAFNVYVATTPDALNPNFLSTRNLCGTYQSIDVVSAARKIEVPCQHIFPNTRYVILERVAKSYLANFLVVAEVLLFQRTNSGNLVFPPRDSGNLVFPPRGLIPNQGFIADQNCQYENHKAGLAIDNDPTTYSISDDKCKSAPFAWWYVDLRKSYKIAGVQITASVLDDYNSNYLRSFNVYVATQPDEQSRNFLSTRQFCFSYQSNNVAIGQVIEAKCINSIDGRYVIIERTRNSHFEKAISLTQVDVYQVV